MKGRACPYGARGPDLAVVQLHDLSNDWQAQAGPSNIAGRVRLDAGVVFEDLLQFFLWNANTVILHKEMNRIALSLASNKNRAAIERIFARVAQMSAFISMASQFISIRPDFIRSRSSIVLIRRVASVWISAAYSCTS
jgi:hypothetical protein